MTKTTEGGSQTLGRGLEALTLIGESATPLSVSELAGKLGVHRSMAYRLVKTFEQYGFVERNPAGELELGARFGSAGAQRRQVLAGRSRTAPGNRQRRTADDCPAGGLRRRSRSHPEHCRTPACRRNRGSAARHAPPDRQRRTGTGHPLHAQPRRAPGQGLRIQPRRSHPGTDASIAVPLLLPPGQTRGPSR